MKRRRSASACWAIHLIPTVKMPRPTDPRKGKSSTKSHRATGILADVTHKLHASCRHSPRSDARQQVTERQQDPLLCIHSCRNSQPAHAAKDDRCYSAETLSQDSPRLNPVRCRLVARQQHRLGHVQAGRAVVLLCFCLGLLRTPALINFDVDPGGPRTVRPGGAKTERNQERPRPFLTLISVLGPVSYRGRWRYLCARASPRQSRPLALPVPCPAVFSLSLCACQNQMQSQLLLVCVDPGSGNW